MCKSLILSLLIFAGQAAGSEAKVEILEEANFLHGRGLFDHLNDFEGPGGLGDELTRLIAKEKGSVLVGGAGMAMLSLDCLGVMKKSLGEEIKELKEEIQKKTNDLSVSDDPEWERTRIGRDEEHLRHVDTISAGSEKLWFTNVSYIINPEAEAWVNDTIHIQRKCRRFRHLVGRLFEKIHAEELKVNNPEGFDLIVDEWGIYEYANDRSKVLLRYVELLAPGGVILIFPPTNLEDNFRPIEKQVPFPVKVEKLGPYRNKFGRIQRLE